MNNKQREVAEQYICESGPADLEQLISSLRWREDMAVRNDFGEHVWLCPCLNESGKRIGITDCCLVSAPCVRHGKIGNQSS